MKRFEVNDNVIWQGMYGPCKGKIKEILNDATKPEDQLYKVNFADLCNFCLRDSELMADHD